MKLYDFIYKSAFKDRFIDHVLFVFVKLSPFNNFYDYFYLFTYFSLDVPVSFVLISYTQFIKTLSEQLRSRSPYSF